MTADGEILTAGVAVDLRARIPDRNHFGIRRVAPLRHRTCPEDDLVRRIRADADVVSVRSARAAPTPRIDRHALRTVQIRLLIRSHAARAQDRQHETETEARRFTYLCGHTSP